MGYCSYTTLLQETFISEQLLTDYDYFFHLFIYLARFPQIVLRLDWAAEQHTNSLLHTSVLICVVVHVTWPATMYHVQCNVSCTMSVSIYCETFGITVC